MRGELPLMSFVFISDMRKWTPEGTVQSNTGLFEGGKKGGQIVTAGRRQPNFLQGLFLFLFSLKEDAMMFQDS